MTPRPRGLLALLTATLVCILPTTILAADPPPKPRSLFLFNTRAIGLADDVAMAINTQIADLLSRRSELSNILTPSDVAQLLSLEQTKQIMGCEDDAGCVAELSKGADTDLVLTSSVGNVGNQMMVSLTLIDARATTNLGRASETIASAEAAAEVLPRLLAELFGWEGGGDRMTFKLEEGAALSLAVFDLKPTGLSPETAQNLTSILAQEFKRIQGVTVISRDDLMAMVQFEGDRQMLGCTGDTSCMAEIGGALGVSKLVVGQAGRLAESFVVSIKLVDAQRAQVESRVTESFRGEEDQLIGAVRHAARRLLGVDDKTPGRMAVSSSERGAELYLDDDLAGELPMPPLSDLVPGRHIVRVSRDGFLDWRSEIYVSPGDTAAVWAPLVERPQAWFQKWWVWTAVGVVVAGAAATTAVLLTQTTPEPFAPSSSAPGDNTAGLQVQ